MSWFKDVANKFAGKAAEKFGKTLNDDLSQVTSNASESISKIAQDLGKGNNQYGQGIPGFDSSKLGQMEDLLKDSLGNDNTSKIMSKLTGIMGIIENRPMASEKSDAGQVVIGSHKHPSARFYTRVDRVMIDEGLIKNGKKEDLESQVMQAFNKKNEKEKAAIIQDIENYFK